MRIRIFLLNLIIMLTLSNCASYDFSRHIVRQGTLLPHSRIDRLKIGMSKEDVSILLGTSLLDPMFNNDRWDYAFTERKGLNQMRKKSLALVFLHGNLVKIEKFQFPPRSQ